MLFIAFYGYHDILLYMTEKLYSDIEFFINSESTYEPNQFIKTLSAQATEANFCLDFINLPHCAPAMVLLMNIETSVERENLFTA